MPLAGPFEALRITPGRSVRTGRLGVVRGLYQRTRRVVEDGSTNGRIVPPSRCHPTFWRSVDAVLARCENALIHCFQNYLTAIANLL